MSAEAHPKQLLEEVQHHERYALLDACSLESLRALYNCYRAEQEKDEPLVSVLLATYKTEAVYLRTCIDSILSQTYANFELLILDDCPEDIAVEAEVAQYKDARIHYRKNKQNKGIAETRNALMEWARGDYFAVIDHDDIMVPERLERQVIYMELNRTVGICGGGYNYFGSWKKRKTVRHAMHSEEIKAGLFFKCTMHHPSIMIRADVIREKAIAYNADYISANDRHLYLDLMPFVEFHNLPQVLMRYRIHAAMTSKTKQAQIQAEQANLRNEMLAKIGVHLSEEETQLLNNFVLRGRCRIRDRRVLAQVEALLVKLNQANLQSGYFPVRAFSKLCGKYLIKRCLNAAVYGRISSKALLEATNLPIQKKPLLLKILNALLH